MSRFAKYITSFPGNADEVTASDVTTFPPSTLYVGTGGTVAVTDAVGRNVVFTNVPNAFVLPVRVTQVLSTGTVDATGFVRIWE